MTNPLVSLSEYQIQLGKMNELHLKNNQLVNIGYQIMRNEGNPLSKNIIYNLLLNNHIINKDGTPTKSTILTMNPKGDYLTELKNIDKKMYQLVKRNARINQSEMHRIDIDADVLQTADYFIKLEIHNIRTQIYFMSMTIKYGSKAHKLNKVDIRVMNDEIEHYQDLILNLKLCPLGKYDAIAKEYNLIFTKLIEIQARNKHDSYLETVASNHFKVACRLYMHQLIVNGRENSGLDMINDTDNEAKALYNENIF